MWLGVGGVCVNVHFIEGRYMERNGTERHLMDIKLNMKIPSAKMAKSLMQMWDTFTDNSCHRPRKRKLSFFKCQNTSNGLRLSLLQLALDIIVFKEFREN